MSTKFNVKTFQGMILALQEYWANQGCTVVQPSRRPTDGRYGENPNRLQHYYQFQVVIKPSPDNIQELYLGSLEMQFSQEKGYHYKSLTVEAIFDK